MWDVALPPNPSAGKGTSSGGSSTPKRVAVPEQPYSLGGCVLAIDTPVPSRCLRILTQATALAALVALFARPLGAAFTEPRLALMRATAYRSVTGVVTVKLEGTFSLDDTVQLALPLDVVVQQGALSARFDLGGNVFTTVGTNPEQPAPGPGVIGVAAREITLVLPPGFAPGDATAQIVATYRGEPVNSNRLPFTL